MSAQNAEQCLDSTTDKASLEKLLNGALKRRREYIEIFKNVTADEVKLTELFDGGGKLVKQRTHTSRFLVYQSSMHEQVVSEYRFTLEVDGKAVNNRLQQAETLFAQLARAKTPDSEWKRLREENLRHTLKYYRWDVTLHPAGQLEEKNWPLYSYDIVGREDLDKRQVIVLSYRRKALYPVKAGRILAGFKDPQIGDQGRLWLDANSCQIYRWENEWVVRHAETGKMLVYILDEVNFVQSDLGVPVPRRIVVSFFDKVKYKPKESGSPGIVLGGRITYTYGPFRRFQVRSQEPTSPLKKDPN